MATEKSRPILRVLTGCTAVGKTEWALRWAEGRGAEIISCDSLLFYRDMDIGTAKPTAAERARVPHHLIDVCDVTGQMDITEYVKLARAALCEIASRGRAALVTGEGGPRGGVELGGSGLAGDRIAWPSRSSHRWKRILSESVFCGCGG